MGRVLGAVVPAHGPPIGGSNVVRRDDNGAEKARAVEAAKRKDAFVVQLAENGFIVIDQETQRKMVFHQFCDGLGCAPDEDTVAGFLRAEFKRRLAERNSDGDQP